MKLVQAIVAVAVLVLAWRQSQIAIEQLRLSREKRQAEELREAREQLTEARQQIKTLVEAKPIVLTDRNDSGDGYRIVNVGQSVAMNVWLIEQGNKPTALGLLPVNASRPFCDPPDHHILIAESRPHTGRRFNRSLNARTRGGNFCHGFLDPENAESLDHDRELEGYLALEPNQWRRFSEWRAKIDDCRELAAFAGKPAPP